MLPGVVSIGRNGKLDRDQCAASGAGRDAEAGLVAVEHAEALADQPHSDTDAAGVERRESRLRDAYAVILDLDQEPLFHSTTAQGDGATADARLESVFDGVFDQGLEQDAGHESIQGVRQDLFDDAEFFTAEPDDFNVEIIVGKTQLVSEGNEGIVIPEHGAEQVGQLDNHQARFIGALTDERGDGVERVEEKMRIDLALQGIEAGFEDEAFLFLELDLDTECVPDLERDADDHRGTEPDQESKPPDIGSQGKEAAWKRGGEPVVEHLHASDEHQEENLSVKARLAEVAPHPAPEAEVDEWSEGPDFFFFDEQTGDAGEEADGKEERESEKFAMEQGRRGHDCGADHGPARPEQEAKQGDRLKGHVSGEKIGDGDSGPDSQSERDEKKAEKNQGLRSPAKRSEEEPLEDAGAGLSARDRGGDAQLDQQRDENQLVICHPLTLPRIDTDLICMPDTQPRYAS